MPVYDQIKKAFQDIDAPEITASRGEIRVLHAEIKRLDEKIDTKFDSLRHELLSEIKRLDEKIDSKHAELLSEIRRLDARLDGLERELKTAIDIRERLAALEARNR